MADYKADQDRFFDLLQDKVEFGEAATREQLAEATKLVDRNVKRMMATGLFPTEKEAREEIVQLMKAKSQLPADYSYPESSNS